jgi:triphosphoribosyl-dephospho-CoA synthetase
MQCKLTPKTYKNVYQKVLASIRYKTNETLCECQKIANRKLTEKEKNDIVKVILEFEKELLEETMILYDTLKLEEDPRVTLKKSFNKFIFDKNWYNDILEIEENHY